jgi:hypothetical protein
VLLKAAIVYFSNMASDISPSNNLSDDLDANIWQSLLEAWPQIQDSEPHNSAELTGHDFTEHETGLLGGDLAEIESSSDVHTPSNSVPSFAEVQQLRTTLFPKDQLLQELAARVQILEQK